jgi:ADP-ribosylglycohydrolase
MLGAIAGDMIGSFFEHHNIKREDFQLFFSRLSQFTDDTVLTCAIADALLTGTPYSDKLREYYNLYPVRGYGGNFRQWAQAGESKPYNSYGNGSAMRVSPVAYAFNDLDTVLEAAKRSAEPTHNHPEGIKGAQSVAGAIFMARQGASKAEIKSFVEERFGYNLELDHEELKKSYTFDVTCQGSVPQAIFCFLISSGFEDAIRKAVSIGGDSDTIACITGSIAEAFYKGVPPEIEKEVMARLDDRLRGIVEKFRHKFIRTS